MRVEKAKFKKADPEDYRLVLMTDDFRCVEPVLEFSNYLVSQNFSPNTIDNYTRDLKVYFEWLESMGLSYLEATPVIIGMYLQYLNGGVWDTPNDQIAVTIDIDSEMGVAVEKQEYAPSTINRMMSAVSSFYTYREVVLKEMTTPFIAIKSRGSKMRYRGLLAHTGNLGESRKLLHTVKVPRLMRRRLSPKEIEKFREGLRTFRDKVIFDVLYEGGLRISELIGLTLDDYSEPDPREIAGRIYLVTRDKKNQRREGRKKTGDRNVDVPMYVIFEIDEYVTQHRPYVKGSQALFVAAKGATKGKSLTKRNVTKLFRECSERTGVKCMPHELRHTHISELKEAGFDNAYIAVRTGNRTSQDDYTHVTELSMRKSMEKVWAARDKREGVNRNE